MSKSAVSQILPPIGFRGFRNRRDRGGEEWSGAPCGCPWPPAPDMWENQQGFINDSYYDHKVACRVEPSCSGQAHELYHPGEVQLAFALE
jgi:hypothetical protein